MSIGIKRPDGYVQKKPVYRIYLDSSVFGRRRGGVVTQRSAKPFTPVQFRSAPPDSQGEWNKFARVVELVYTRDLKSLAR